MIEWLGPGDLSSTTRRPRAPARSSTRRPGCAKPGTVGKADPADQVHRRRRGRHAAAGRRGSASSGSRRRRRALRVLQRRGQDRRRRTGGDYFTLGDVGYLDDDGFLFLTDRSANLIISGGVNIYPAEVDAVLLEHPAVADVATIGVPERRVGRGGARGRRARARRRAVRRARRTSCSRSAATRLAHFKCPRRVDFVDAPPAPGQRQDLQAPPARRVPRQAGSVLDHQLTSPAVESGDGYS